MGKNSPKSKLDIKELPKCPFFDVFNSPEFISHKIWQQKNSNISKLCSMSSTCYVTSRTVRRHSKNTCFQVRQFFFKTFFFLMFKSVGKDQNQECKSNTRKWRFSCHDTTSTLDQANNWFSDASIFGQIAIALKFVAWCCKYGHKFENCTEIT